MFYEDIRAEVKRNWADLEASSYPEDLLTEWADSSVPIFNSDIYSQWGDLPSEAQDAWADAGYETGPRSTIIELMRVDLFLHIESLYTLAYRAIAQELEGEGN